MNIRVFHCVASALFASALCCAAANATVTPVKVADNVYTFTGPMANCTALVTDDGILMVDSGETAQLGEELLAAVGTLSPKPVRYLVNTHLHFDHTSGNAAFAAAGATIIGQDNMRRSFTTKISPPNNALPPREAWPVQTFSDSMTIFIGGEEVFIHHAQTHGAHTAGDAFVYFRRANVLATGDIMFNGMFPSIDLSEGGWTRGIAASCRAAASIIDNKTIVIPGHGPLTDKKGLEAYAVMLDDISSRVEALAAQGKTLDQIKAAHPTDRWDEMCGHSTLPPAFTVTPDYFVYVVYEGIVAHANAAR
jgi:cyclase